MEYVGSLKCITFRDNHHLDPFAGPIPPWYDPDFADLHNRNVPLSQYWSKKTLNIIRFFITLLQAVT